jgi:threonine/homoserine/homoserine lactone efflux protein
MMIAEKGWGLLQIETFLLAVACVLIAPGPTNTLIGLTGATKGMGRAARLIPAELAGYLTSILPFAALGARFSAYWPQAAVAMKISASIWLLILAMRLWKTEKSAEEPASLGPVRIYVTTALNPKALLFALVLLPAWGDPQFPGRLGLFCMMVASVAMLWGSAGVFLKMADGTGHNLPIVRQVASGWLAVLSVTLATSVVFHA